VVSNPAWIDRTDPSLPTLVISTLDGSFVGHHTIVVVAKLNTAPIKSASTTVTFNLLIEITDPCYNVVLHPEAVLGMSHTIEPYHVHTKQTIA